MNWLVNGLFVAACLLAGLAQHLHGENKALDLQLQHARLVAAEAVADLVAQDDACAKALEADASAIAALRATNEDQARQLGALASAADAAIASAEAAARDAWAMYYQQRRETEVLYAKDDAARAWGDQLLPPDVARRLQHEADEARRHHRPPRGGGGGADAGGADAARPDAPGAGAGAAADADKRRPVERPGFVPGGAADSRVLPVASRVPGHPAGAGVLAMTASADNLRANRLTLHIRLGLWGDNGNWRISHEAIDAISAWMQGEDGRG